MSRSLISLPDGSGQSVGEALHETSDWPSDRAVIDAFDARLSTKQIAQALTSVGFSSPPSWIKPYRVLSGGERFRCDLA